MEIALGLALFPQTSIFFSRHPYITACTKRRNVETKRPKRNGRNHRNHRNDRNETTETKQPKRNDRNETAETKRPKRNETAENINYRKNGKY